MIVMPVWPVMLAWTVLELVVNSGVLVLMLVMAWRAMLGVVAGEYYFLGESSHTIVFAHFFIILNSISRHCSIGDGACQGSTSNIGDGSW